MWIEHCQERSFAHKMYLKKCLQSIGFCVDCRSGQFVCYLLHLHGLMVLSDDGLVQVAWIQTYPYFSVLVSSGMSLKRPMVLALLAPWWFPLLSGSPVPCLLPPLTRLAPSFWHVLLAWLWGPPWCCRLPSNCQVCQMSWGIVSSNPPRSCMTLFLVHGRLVLPCCLAICLCHLACGWGWGLVDTGGDLCCWSEMSWYH